MKHKPTEKATGRLKLESESNYEHEMTPCPSCGAPINEVLGLKSADCHNCGYHPSCCN